MAGVGSLDLYDALSEFFDVCLAALADTPAGAPECAYLSPGPPAWDSFPCLVCHVGGPNVGDTYPLQPALSPGHRVALASQVNLVQLTATVLRCAPLPHENGDLPTVADFATATKQQTADLWAILNHVRAAKKAATLFPPLEREFMIDPSVAVIQAGGACGWQISVRTQLEGYRP